MPTRLQPCSTSRMQPAAVPGVRPRPQRLAVPGPPAATRLSQSEMDALRGQIQRYWNIIPGMADGGDVRVTVRMRLDVAGNIIGEPDVSATGGSAGTRGTLRAAPSARYCGRSPTSCLRKKV
jgi:hypothetical protein